MKFTTLFLIASLFCLDTAFADYVQGSCNGLQFKGSFEKTDPMSFLNIKMLDETPYEVHCWYGTSKSDNIYIYYSNPNNRKTGDIMLNGKVIGKYDTSFINVFLGFNGDDHITGGDGEDWIYGMSGNDTINGNDRPALSDHTDQDYKQQYKDEIKNDNDYLAGGPGNDQITGGRGHDYIAGGSGVDVIFTGDQWSYFDVGPLNGSQLDHVTANDGDEFGDASNPNRRAIVKCKDPIMKAVLDVQMINCDRYKL